MQDGFRVLEVLKEGTDTVLMIFWLFFGIVAATIAAAKGRSGFGYFCLGMLIGPFSRAVALLPPVNR